VSPVEAGERRDRGTAGDEQYPERSLRARSGRIRTEDDRAARDPVGQHPGRQDDDDECERIGAEDDAEIGRGVGEP